MSVKCTNWVWSLKGLSPGLRILLLKYADNANDDGLSCHPGMKYLIEKTELSESTILRHKKVLISRGLITEKPRFTATGRQTTNAVQLHLSEGVKLKGSPRQNETHEGVNSDGVEGVNSDTLITLNHQKEPPEIENPSCPDITSGRGKRKYKFTDAQYSVSASIWEQIRVVNPTMKHPNLDSWANDVRLMVEQDNRTLTQIADVFLWANRDDFWKSNILSTSKLRKQFDSLTAKMRNQRNTGPHGSFKDQQYGTTETPDWAK